MADKPTIRSLITCSALAPPTQNALIKWAQYRLNEGDGYNKTRIDALITAAEAAEREYGPMAVVSVVCGCICEGLGKVYWDRLGDFKKAERNDSEPERCSRDASPFDIARMKRMCERL